MLAKQQSEKKVRHIQLNLPADVYKDFRSNCVNEDTNMRAKLLTLIAAYNEEKKNKESHRQIKQFLEMPKKEREAMLSEATHKAIAETHALGLPTTHGDNKGVYRLYPDGHKEYIERYEEKKKNARR
jgi:hypothetical protein